MTHLTLTLLLLATGASAAPAKPQIPVQPENVIQIERDSQLKPEPKATPTDAPDRRTDERYSM
ncbi:hypothetical protein [Pseudomonas capsici]|uniref:hypothetical protein n=1 Tax=Pseudomonas capsici TaxID=2810614 RepID=UPI0021F0D636|nr:hypothetical protein [Pseudomonas capsici]MCV4343131.1 hypothetical protein [Pseudomonas capsici]